MLGLTTLDVAIGIAFFYLIFSLICTTANEAIARWLKRRPRTLQEAIHQLLGNTELENAVLAHPLIGNLSRSRPGKAKGGSEVPSYIPASTFATALLDLLTGKEPITDLPAVRNALAARDASGGSISTQDGKSIPIPCSTEPGITRIGSTLKSRVGTTRPWIERKDGISATFKGRHTSLPQRSCCGRTLTRSRSGAGSGPIRRCVPSWSSRRASASI